MKVTALGAAAALTPGAAMAEAAPENPFPKAAQWGKIPGEGTDEEKIRLTRDAGFDGIEAYPMDDLEAARARGELARSLNCPIHSITYGGWDAPMSSPDPAAIKQGHAGIENALRTAKAVGAETMLLVPAVVTESVSYAQAWENSQKNIRPMIPLAEELGIMIAIENVWNKFLLSPLEFAKYIDEFESPWVQAYFDVGNVVAFGYPEDWIRTLGKRIHKVQWKDFKRKTNEWCKLPYEGDVNWPVVRQALDEIGYRSWGTEEFPKGDEAQFRELARRMDLLGKGAASA
ncbi:MAG: sugar phosphate isomerase/epimerase [Candidatus Hydrogenedentes bacterium]|nr:sugar phosphate isomerase/epimerase [Candidatus Hydrogenedentota bacterium]